MDGGVVVKSHPLAAAVRKALDGLEVPCAGGTVVVGLSGGPDSVALADALARLAPARRLRVVAAHLDHGLRPGSAEDARFCAELAARLGLAFRSSTAHVRARRRGGGLEAAGREARYAFLRATARDEGALAIAVAHTRDDQAETVLLRLLRGSGSRGLAAMRPRAGDLIRPLLGVSRSEVMSYLAARALPWREDPSNADPAFLRNRVRHELLPYLELRFNRGVRGALARTGSILADEADALAGDARGLLAAIGRRDGDGLLLSAAGLRGAPQAVARLALLLALEDTGGARAIGAVHLERLLGLARRDAGATGRLELPGRREAVARYGLLRIGPRPAEAPAPRGRGLPGTAGLEVAP
jgi:tRNA(Ile)-lysidine synthase